jgi:hypothetical protein
MKKKYVKPIVVSKGSANVVASMGCASGGDQGRSHCLRA